MDEQGTNTDAVLARIAEGQHGVVAMPQLRAAGIGKDCVWRAVRAGRLHRVYRGVYAVGHRGLSNEGRWMAAVLACGDGAVLSHRSAAELWGLLRPAREPIDVITRRSAGRKHDDLRIHRSPSLPTHETTIRDGIAVTTPTRTLRDLPRVVPTALVRRATRQAEYLRLPLADLKTDGTRSDLEARFLRLCRRHRIPTPEVNERMGPYTVDFLWREQRLVVETDAYATHRGRQAFEDDRARELYLHSEGYTVRRFTDAQVGGQPAAVAAAVALALSSPPGRIRRQSPP